MWTALAIIGGLLASGALGVGAAHLTANAQKEANDTNVYLQQQANEQNAEIAQATNEENWKIAKLTTAASMLEAQKNRDFQLEMSNTAHQREVADLLAAGLNPYASVEGSGAAVTGGAVGQVHGATMQSARMEAARVNAVDQGGALANLASTAQSLAFMAALQARTNTTINGYKQIAAFKALSRAGYR